MVYYLVFSGNPNKNVITERRWERQILGLFVLIETFPTHLASYKKKKKSRSIGNEVA